MGFLFCFVCFVISHTHANFKNTFRPFHFGNAFIVKDRSFLHVDHFCIQWWEKVHVPLLISLYFAWKKRELAEWFTEACANIYKYMYIQHIWSKIEFVLHFQSIYSIHVCFYWNDSVFGFIVMLKNEDVANWTISRWCCVVDLYLMPLRSQFITFDKISNTPGWNVAPNHDGASTVFYK